MKILCRCLAALLVVWTSSAWAVAIFLDPETGIRVTMASTESALSAAPWPGLETTKERTIPISAGYISASSSDMADGASALGSYAGGSAGLGYISRSHEDFRFFAFVVGNKVTGTVNLNLSDGTQQQLRNVDTSGASGAVGAAWRFLGDGKSTFAAGLFAAPAYLFAQGSFDYYAGSSLQTAYNATGNFYGPLMGAQVALRIGSFIINPYGLTFIDLSPVCQNISTNVSIAICQNLTASFGGAGINLGYGGLQLTVYSAVLAGAAVSDISVVNYRATYGFQF